MMPQVKIARKKSDAVKQHDYHDWICILCQNLNYSFRDRCTFKFYVFLGDRCKIQSKQNN
jgi:hypothetical protein